MEIIFIPHAQRKFKLLEKYGFFIREEKVITIVKTPERVIPGKKGRRIAQSRINDNHVLRVVFEEKEDKIEVITFYPGRRNRYED